MKLGIQPLLIDSGHPEQNGVQERMHRTLTTEFHHAYNDLWADYEPMQEFTLEDMETMVEVASDQDQRQRSNAALIFLEIESPFDLVLDEDHPFDSNQGGSP